MYRGVVLISSLAIGASVANMDWNLWGMINFIPAMIAINWVGALVVGWAWLPD